MGLAKLRNMSNRYGANPEYVLAGGGNTSYKEDGFLYVKGSGVSLADIDEKGFVKLDRSKLEAVFSKRYAQEDDLREEQVLSDLLKARVPGEDKRPSVETLLHHIFPGAYVLHLHPAVVNGMLCAKEGRRAFERLFAGEGLWIEPVMPGYTLSLKVRRALEDFMRCKGHAPSYVFLENHGVFTGADTVEEIDRLFDSLYARASALIVKKPDFSPCPYDEGRAAAAGDALRRIAGGVQVFVTNRQVLACTKDREAFGRVSPALTPDHMVYCRGTTLFVEQEETQAACAELEAEFARYKARYGAAPRIVGFANLGYFACGATQKEAVIASEVFLDAVKVAVYAESFGGCKPMPVELVNRIGGWEVERYRQSVSFGQSNKNGQEA